MSHAATFVLRIVRLRCAALAMLVGVGLPLPAGADILIGVAVPSQGAKTKTGGEIRRAAELAAAHLNANGGLLGARVGVVATDDGCSASQAEAAARTLVAQRVALVVGHPCTGAAVAAARVYAEAGVPFIASATRHPDLTDQRAGPMVFRLAGRDDRQGTAAGSYLARKFAGEPIAVVYDGSRYAKVLVDDALAAIKADSASDVMTATVRGGQKDYAALIARLKEANTRALLFAGFPMEGALLLRQMRAAGLDTEFLAGDALATASFTDTAGDAAEGAVALLPHDALRAQIDGDKLARLEADQRATGVLLATYAAIEAWAAAAEQAGSADSAAVVNTLQNGRFDTVQGTISFDQTGDARVPSFDVVEWKDHAWRLKQPRDSAGKQ